MASTAASTRSVSSERRPRRATTSSPSPATAKRTPAPSSGGVSSRPILIATHVLDQMSTSSAYSDQTTPRPMAPHPTGRAHAQDGSHALAGGTRPASDYSSNSCSCPWPVLGFEPKPRWRPPVRTPGGGPPGWGSPARPRCVGRSRSRLGWTRLGSPFCLGKCGGQGASPRPPSSSRRASSSNWSSEPGAHVDVRSGIAQLAQAAGHGVEAQVARLDVGDLVPAQGARHAGVRRRAHGVARGDRAVAGVLVVVDEHSLALLLPPLAGREVGRTALHLAGQRERGATHLEEVPARLHTDVDVDALGAGRLGIAAQPVLAEHVVHHHRRTAHRVPRDARRGIEIDPQLVGMVEVAASRGPRVEVDDAEVDRPGQMGGVVGHELLRGAAGREVDGRRLQPVRHAPGHPLLPDRLLEDPVDEALHHRRALADVHQRRIGDVDVVPGDVELRPARPGEVDLRRVRQPNLATRHLERRVRALGHRSGAYSRPTRRIRRSLSAPRPAPRPSRRARGPRRAGWAGSRRCPPACCAPARPPPPRPSDGFSSRCGTYGGT